MLSLARVEREVAAAANRLAAMDLGEGGESLTQTASNRRAAREELARRTKATANDENDEKLHASREAIDAYARAAEGAKRNAVRLAAVLEREVAMGNAGRSRDILEQRCAAALCSVAAARTLDSRCLALPHVASPRFAWSHPTSPMWSCGHVAMWSCGRIPHRLAACSHMTTCCSTRHDHMLHMMCRVRAQGVGCERGGGGASEQVCAARMASAPRGAPAGRLAYTERRRRARGGAAAAR
jgi:hypothetical protein